MTDEENLHMLLSAVLDLAKHNIPPDVLELLVKGNPDKGIPRGALFSALAVANGEAYDNFERARHRIAMPSVLRQPTMDDIDEARRAGAEIGNLIVG